jgi:polysaccharide export outer membrane protein
MQKIIACCWSLLLALVIAGCAPYRDLPAGSVKDIDCAVVERQAVMVTAPLPDEAPPSSDYVIGSGDVLFVNVNGRPELSTNSLGNNVKISGSRVDGSGAIQLPLAGSVEVAGLTVPKAALRVAEAYRPFLKEPWAVLEVAEFRSRPLYLLGQFRRSGVVYMDRPLTLLQGIGMGDGFDGQANIRAARLIRNNRTMPVDLYDLLVNGDQKQNVWLQPGDTVFLPDSRNQQVFVFGAVKKPGPVPIPQSGLTLSQAIASAELREIGYDFRHVRVIRSYSPTKGELMVVDFDRILRGEALTVALREGDIIYVPKSGVGTWNDAIAEILPSLQAVSAILQPFVQIKFLSDNND